MPCVWQVRRHYTFAATVTVIILEDTEWLRVQSRSGREWARQAGEETRLAHTAPLPVALAAWVLAVRSLLLPSCFNPHQPHFQVLVLNQMSDSIPGADNTLVQQPALASGLGKPQSVVTVPPQFWLCLHGQPGPSLHPQTWLTSLTSLPRPHEGGAGRWAEIWKIRVGSDHGIVFCSSAALCSHSHQPPPHSWGRETTYSRQSLSFCSTGVQGPVGAKSPTGTKLMFCKKTRKIDDQWDRHRSVWQAVQWSQFPLHWLPPLPSPPQHMHVHVSTHTHTHCLFFGLRPYTGLVRSIQLSIPVYPAQGPHARPSLTCACSVSRYWRVSGDPRGLWKWCVYQHGWQLPVWMSSGLLL